MDRQNLTDGLVQRVVSYLNAFDTNGPICFVNFKRTTNGKEMKIFCNIMTVFLPVLFKIIKVWDTCLREINLFPTGAKLLIYSFFLTKLGQLPLNITWNCVFYANLFLKTSLLTFLFSY